MPVCLRRGLGLWLSTRPHQPASGRVAPPLGAPPYVITNIRREDRRGTETEQELISTAFRCILRKLAPTPSTQRETKVGPKTAIPGLNEGGHHLLPNS